MTVKRRRQYSILGMLVLTCIAAFVARSVLAWRSEPWTNIATTFYIENGLSNQAIVNGISVDPTVLERRSFSKIRNPSRWIKSRVSVKSSSRNARHAVIEVSFRSNEITTMDIDAIVDAAWAISAEGQPGE